MYTEDSDGDAVPYNDFVSLARDEGLVALEVQVVQAPSEGNGRTAVVQAIARTRDGSFGAVGEASPASAPAAWQPFLITLAELRAKARALRELTGLDHAVQEELAVPYRVEGAAGLKERLAPAPAPRGRSAAETATAPPLAPDVPETPVDLASIPGLQRGVGALRTATQTASASSAPRFTVPQAEDGEEESDVDGAQEAAEDEDRERAATPVPRMAGMPETPRAPTPIRVVDDAPAEYDAPPDYDAVPPDMLDKLKRLAVSIAALEGTELSDAQAILKLDDFFMRAFRHPLGKATRMEGQRVVQKLSSDLSKRRAAANGGDEE